ncbi:TetR/AcrR family transcriptional regulator [Litorimonas sp. RW-G-Af-16]|uniref:TetR/AcrR family transcriptional regulator n=1 Tax=Litorimonas sp. RW-G-Af-16 TaxID=3241168 RepID=UPI00390CA83E
MKEIVSDERGVIAAAGTGKARIERAALTLFSETSIDGVSTKSIATLAGVSEGLLYRHFKSKDDLARQMMLTIHNDLTYLIHSAYDLYLEEAVAHIVENYCALADEDWALFRYHILHLHRFPGLSNTPTQNPLGAATQLIAKAQNEGTIASKERPEVLAAMALGVVLSAAQAKVLGGISGPLSDHKDQFIKTVMAVLNVA